MWPSLGKAGVALDQVQGPVSSHYRRCAVVAARTGRSSQYVTVCVAARLCNILFLKGVCDKPSLW
jgi:hypothetical protein